MTNKSKIYFITYLLITYFFEHSINYFVGMKIYNNLYILGKVPFIRHIWGYVTSYSYPITSIDLSISGPSPPPHTSLLKVEQEQKRVKQRFCATAAN